MSATAVFYISDHLLGTWQMRNGEFVTITEETAGEWDQHGNSCVSPARDLIELERPGKWYR